MLKNTAKLNITELDNVAGGTVKEFNEIFDAYNSLAGSYMESIGSGARELLDILGTAGSGAKSAVICALATPFEKALKHDFDIDAYISVGWGGTGFRSTHNRYSKNGKSLTHQEVVDMIRAA